MTRQANEATQPLTSLTAAHDDLFVQVQPGHLGQHLNDDSDENDVMEMRASLVRQTLNS